MRKSLGLTLLSLTFFIFVLVFPKPSFSHQPRIPEGEEVEVIDPEISKAYYSQLEGKPHIYKIISDKEFNLYANILVPDVEGAKKDVSVTIFKNNDRDNPLIFLDPKAFEWKRFWEPFGQSSYLQGPEYKATVEAGEYEIVVQSEENNSKYSLAIGEIESFDAKESVNALRLVPEIKRNFFKESAANFILSPLGFGYIILIYFSAFISGFAYRKIIRRFSKNISRKSGKNIGKKDRLVRVAIGIFLLGLAITTTWNPILLFLSGFSIFEAIFSWCGIYAALAKNTCPIDSG